MAQSEEVNLNSHVVSKENNDNLNVQWTWRVCVWLKYSSTGHLAAVMVCLYGEERCEPLRCFGL